MIESERLSYVRNNQKKLRVHKFYSLQQSSEAGNTEGLGQGKRIILPSTFVGSPRYMDQLYFDGIAICSHDDREFIAAIQEAKDWGSAPYLRNLFVLLLLTGTMNKPEEVWEKTWHWLSDDIVYSHRRSSNTPGLHIDDSNLMNLVLLEVEKLLLVNQRSLKDYPSMPYPENANLLTHVDNHLILSELNFNNEELRSEFLNLFSQMTALDRSLRDVIKAKSSAYKIFGGKVMLFGGDFRQILPVIPRGSRSNIVNSTINSSYLWNHCHVLTLLKNMRLEANTDAIDKEEIAAFAKWILNIGDGTAGQPNDSYGSIEISKDLSVNHRI
ncbi:hypothetical protein D0Y65_055215 [Glycine soja]|uniref:ATP-dependent DNA helicase n=1 Tax=Glycine soja TaxID=3848 RepID=A0A445EYL0_GLYSO|nr:hypothetical protein D0Y65_055215 [Glycine soja]